MVISTNFEIFQSLNGVKTNIATTFYPNILPLGLKNSNRFSVDNLFTLWPQDNSYQKLRNQYQVSFKSQISSSQLSAVKSPKFQSSTVKVPSLLHATNMSFKKRHSKVIIIFFPCHYNCLPSGTSFLNWP